MTVRPVISIARLTLRSAARSRVVLAMLGLLLLIITALPLIIRGDGTPAGEMTILLQYTLGLSMVLLAFITVWIGCAAVAGDIEHRQAHMTLTKPLTRGQLCLGRWLGIALIDALLLLVTMGAVYAQAHLTLRRISPEPAAYQALTQQLLTARRAQDPDLTRMRQLAEQVLNERLQERDLPPAMSRKEALAELMGSMQRSFFSVPHGEENTWTFPYRPGASGAPPLLSYRMVAADITAGITAGTFILRGENKTELTRIDVTHQAGRNHQLSLDMLVGSYTGQTLQVTYRNHAEKVTTVYFAPEAFQLLLPAGSFLGNLLKVSTYVYIRLLFLAALGVAAGALLSLPVAALVSMYVILMLIGTPYVYRTMHEAGGHSHGAQEESVWQQAAEQVIAVAHYAMAPLQTPGLFTALSQGRYLDRRQLLKSGAAHTGYILLFLAGGAWLFKRRELALS